MRLKKFYILQEVFALWKKKREIRKNIKQWNVTCLFLKSISFLNKQIVSDV